ncbi:hypothetical protein HRUBRA_01349 [Pseudohaliea rubra DSM 19751]|uniref:Uncharacterized protein n=1 Tax=Pseudohaliea rubra DSM 19751 TaxID=1265313 RepID=A0A095VRZ4_9GAMM|nr:hypothetical protein HRUBRA_01349 [Pseudohaliea rubra DSM 19751]
MQGGLGEGGGHGAPRGELYFHTVFSHEVLWGSGTAFNQMWSPELTRAMALCSGRLTPVFTRQRSWPRAMVGQGGIDRRSHETIMQPFCNHRGLEHGQCHL